MSTKLTSTPTKVRIDSIRIDIADNGFILKWTEVVKTPSTGKECYENTQWIDRSMVYSDEEGEGSEIAELLADARKLRDISRSAQPKSLLDTGV